VRRDYPNSGKYGVKSYIYNPIENKQYALYRFTDTVYWYYADSNYVSDFIILDSCSNNEISFQGKYLDCLETSGFDSHLNLKTSTKYHYLPNRYLFNYDSWLKNKDFAIGRVYEIIRSNILAMFADYGNYEYTMIATHLLEVEIEDRIFEISSDLPLKKQ
ncbi:MAG: hypothetical protein AAGJ82_05860, partial [Bacteroidota bacterium]